MALGIDSNTTSEIFALHAERELQNRQYLFGLGKDYEGEGRELNIPIILPFEMNLRDFSSANLTETIVEDRNVICDPLDYAVKVPIGDSQATLFSYDRVQAVVDAEMESIGRTLDYVKLIQIFANTYSTALNNLIPLSTSGTTGLTIRKLKDAQTKLAVNGYPPNAPLIVFGNADAIDVLFDDNQFTDWDYNPTRPYSEPEGRQFQFLLGMSIRHMGKQGINQIPTTGANLTTAVYVAPVTSTANKYNIRPRGVVANDPNQLRTNIISQFTMGTGIIYPTAIIKIEVDTIPQSL